MVILKGIQTSNTPVGINSPCKVDAKLLILNLYLGSYMLLQGGQTAPLW